MKVVLITGGNGALGQAITECLRKDQSCHVIVTSRHSNDESVVQLDVCNFEHMDAAIRNIKPDLVLHLAATFSNDFDEAYAVNVKATKHLLDAVQQLGNRTRVILIGSAAEYGVVNPEENPIREDHILNPVSVYGLTKAWQTQLSGLYASYGVDVVVARVFNLDGPGVSERLFIGRLQQQIDDVLAGRKSVIELGPLDATRDYVSIQQATTQILAIAAHGERGKVYHVASGIPVKMRSLLNHYLSQHKLETSIVKESVALTNHIGYDVPVIYADITDTIQLMNRSNSVEA